MKRSVYLLLLGAFASHIPYAHSLDIDEKLTLRFLNVSSTKKTVLINRGGEDGLVVGDHAKFFITAGVVARGVAEKVSPSRSVWALYRIVDPAEITQDKALNLKIATPAKITDDPSKSFKDEPIPGGTEAMAISEDGVEKGEVAVDEAEKDELKGLGAGLDEETHKESKDIATSKKGSKNTKVTSVIEESPIYTTNKSKTWEVWGTLNVNSLSGTVESTSETASTDSTSNAASTIDFAAGVEKYFLNFNNFLKEVSVSGFVHKRSIENGNTVKTTADWFEYGAILNYHFFNSAASINRFVGFGSLSVGTGSASFTAKAVNNGVATEDTPEEGTTKFFSAGVGAKYVLNSGFGMRALLDYYSATETYDYDTYTVKRKLAGPRIQFGLSYRF